MYASERDFGFGEALGRIKSPDSVTLLRPVEKLHGRWVTRTGPGVGYSLCFRQKGFAAVMLPRRV
jgi:hypothetical protein